MKRWIVIVLASVMTLIAGMILAWVWAVSPVGGPSQTISVAVPHGSSTRRVANLLKERNAIRSASAFVLMARLRGVSSSLRSGRYDFKSSMSLSEVLDKIARGDVSALWVTIPEGYTGKQIARVLASKKLVNDAVFTQDVYQPTEAVTAPFAVPSGSLEGYLFPDTYLVPFHDNPHSVVKLMLDNFDKRVVKGMAGEIQASGMSLHQIITVASMIEREARVPEDRPLIASVIYNRLRQGMPLQIDATVEYALGGHRARIYYRDLKVDSPYNTYRHRGLPPGPISNPGLSSIQAALHPAATDYLFYVAGPDGRHLFSRTVQEHGEAIQKVRRGE